MCIEREKATFKSREVNVLKECALALTRHFARTLTARRIRLGHSISSILI